MPSSRPSRIMPSRQSDESIRSVGPWSPNAWQEGFGQSGYSLQTLGTSSANVVDFRTHMTKGRMRTAKEIITADRLNPLINDHKGPKDHSNVPVRFELYLLGPGEKKVIEEPDTRIPSTSTFTFNKEDHTLGNLLTARLHQSQHVVFAAYKVPHPLESLFTLRIGTDGTLTPRGAVLQSCRELVNELALLNQEFTKEYELRKMVGAEAKAESSGVDTLGMHPDGTADANGMNHRG